MKWKTYKRALTSNTKTFLVLPSVDDSDAEMNKKDSLRLFTKTWPPKNEEKDENARPLTATLEKPEVLDIRLVGKIDMSLMRKEFLSITNLCKTPATTINRISSRRKTAVLERRRPISNLPIAISPTEKSKFYKKADTTSEDSWEEESSLSSRDSSRKLKSKLRPPTIIITKKLEIPLPNEINNNLKILRRRTPKSTSPESIKLLPEPCTTCGRPDLPERFHSHPTTPLKPIRKFEPKIPVKKTVQKPVAIRYKSKGEEKKLRLAQLSPTKIDSGEPEAEEMKAIKSKGPRTLTCYICGREFGTASLHLHEPKCLEKWERENYELPKQLQRKPPVKPDKPMSREEWNKSAWEASQAALSACLNCGRTFYPDRLLVHQRSCKGTQQVFTKSASARNLNQPSNSTNQLPASVQCSICGKLFGTKSIKIHEPQCIKKWNRQKESAAEKIAEEKADEDRPQPEKKPAMFPCYLCGRLFGINSIYIHEPQCLKKWRMENEKLPPHKRRQEPLKPDIKFTQSAAEKIAEEKADEDRPQPEKKPAMFPCYLCGRLFGINSIYIHEPQCLKKWRMENEKLPPHKRRQEPLKPDIKFTQDGKIDYKATEEAHWQSHLNQLVPCQHCKRRFNPDRVDIHERSCKGPNKT